jgi:hypothetical protein
MSVYKIIWRRWRMNEIWVRNISGTILTPEVLSIRIKISLTATSFSINPTRPRPWSNSGLRWAPWERSIYINTVNRINTKFAHSLLVWTANTKYNRIVKIDTENEHAQKQQELLPDSEDRSAAGWKGSIASRLVYYTVSRSAISVHVTTISPRGSPTVKPCRVFRDPR